MDLDRRTLLRALPVFIGVTTAGCSLPGGSQTPEPTVSEPRHIDIYNDDDEPHEVTVAVFRGREGNDQLFESTFDLQPAESEQTEGVSRVGEYRIRVTTAAGEEATTLWRVEESRGETQVNISREGRISIGQEVRAGSE